MGSDLQSWETDVTLRSAQNKTAQVRLGDFTFWRKFSGSSSAQMKTKTSTGSINLSRVQPPATTSPLPGMSLDRGDVFVLQRGCSPLRNLKLLVHNIGDGDGFVRQQETSLGKRGVLVAKLDV